MQNFKNTIIKSPSVQCEENNLRVYKGILNKCIRKAKKLFSHKTTKI